MKSQGALFRGELRLWSWNGRLEYGAVTWPGDIDLALDVMYEEIKNKGEWDI